MPESLSYVRCSVHPHSLQLQQAAFDTGTALEQLDLMEWKMEQVVDPKSSPVSKGFNAFCVYDPNPNVVSDLPSEEPICCENSLGRSFSLMAQVSQAVPRCHQLGYWCKTPA